MRKNLYLTFDKLRLFLKDSHEEGEYEYLLDHINRLIRGQEEGARLIGNEDRFTKGARKLGKQEITYLAVLRMYALEKKQQLSSALKIENISSNQQSEIWSYIGDLYYLEGIYDEAISCYDRAISFGGDVGILDWCCFQKYYIFSLQGKTDKADKFLERINDTSSCWTLLGNYYVEPLKEPFRALECFDNAIDLNEKNVDAYVLKSKTLKSLGKKEEAKAIFKSIPVSTIMFKMLGWFFSAFALSVLSSYFGVKILMANYETPLGWLGIALCLFGLVGFVWSLIKSGKYIGILWRRLF